MLGISLGLVALGFAGVAWFVNGLEGTRAISVGMAILSAFSGLGAIACLVPASRPVTLRLVGGVVFLACLGYMIEMLLRGPVLGKSRADQSLVNSIFALVAFGLPAGYVAIRGRYPSWGRHASSFGAETPSLPDKPRDPDVGEPKTGAGGDV
jgi:hypothetical protein